MHFDEEYTKIADYFVVAGLTDTSKPLDDELTFSDTNHKRKPEPKDPITDVCIINRTLEERCPQGFTCIEQTPLGFQANLNHGSFTAHDLMLCYKRGRDKPPLVEIGVYYEGMENVKNGIGVVKVTPTGKSANINNKSGLGSHPIYMTYHRARESDSQSTLVVTDLCVILTNKGEQPPHAFCKIDRNINKGIIGSSVYICYKKSMRQVNSIAFRAGILSRYPMDDSQASFPLPMSVGLFCLPMGATIECWTEKTKHPLPSFSTFVLTTETFEKIYGAVVSFYEPYPEENLAEEHKYKLGLLRGDGHKTIGTKTIHTNKAICFLSKWPLFDAFRDILIYLYRLTVSPTPHPLPVERYISHFMHKVPFPTQHRPRVQYQMSPMHATILTRPQITPIPLSGASFVALLDDLGAENLLQLLTLAITEHKIVIHSLRQAEITRVAEAIITLLFPFKWQCTYVPLCPLEMAYVLEAPTPFIVGVDSRYFDLYEPPPDVVCVNLDTNSITHLEDKQRAVNWRMLPKKSARHLRTKLHDLYDEIKQTNLSEDPTMPFVFDPDLAKTKRRMNVEIIIQEGVLKLMVAIMEGYRDYLRPITEAPMAATADAASLFNFTEFIKQHRDRSSHRFYQIFTNTQMFLTFIEERSLGKGGLADRGEKAESLVFFDECTDKLENEHPSDIRLIETDDTVSSGPTVIIMPPDEKGLPENNGYQYTIFPELKEELFMWDEEEIDGELQSSAGNMKRKPSSLMFGKRTKQETKMTQKEAQMNNRDPKLWARNLLSSTFSIWFNCLTEFTGQCKSKEAALRAGHNALITLQNFGCIPLPDETSYRVLMHLCYVYNKPALAVRIYHFIQQNGGQLSALTYGLYNKALLETKWPTTNRDGYMLWQKLRNVIIAISRFRYVIRYHSNTNSVAMPMSDGSSDFDSASRVSIDSGKINYDGMRNKPAINDDKNSVENSKDDLTRDVQLDHGYSTLPKEDIQSNFPPRLSPMSEQNGTETTDSVISTTSGSTTDSRFDKLEPVHSGRNAQPPTTLLIPQVNIPGGGDGPQYQPLKSDDDTVVNFQHGVDGAGDGGANSHTGSIVRTPGTPGSVGSGGGITPNRMSSEDFHRSMPELNEPDEIFEQKEPSKSQTPNKLSPLLSRKDTSSPSPELATFFGDDSKFLADLSDSDKMRHQELSTRRPSALDTPTSTGPRHRSGSALPSSHQLSVGGGISPLVGHKPSHFQFGSSSAANTPVSAGNTFDSLTADDFIASPHHRHRSIFSSGGSARSHSRSMHGEDEATTPSAPAKRFIRTAPGTCSLHVVDGVAMLTSTPMRVLPSQKEIKEEEGRTRSLPRPAKHKLKMERQDITDLALDPLSALSIGSPVKETSNKKEVTPVDEDDSKLNRHLVAEIENHQKRDSFLNPVLNRSQSVSMNKSTNNQDIKRQMSHTPGQTPVKENPGPPAVLSRSNTFHNDSSFIGAKWNSLLKNTTMEMANKAKKLASNIAKDLNDTMQTNLAYYTPEKFKGSLPDILKEEESRGATSVGSSRNDLHSSQSSLRSSESATDGSAQEEIRRRSGSLKNRRKANRPLSLPSSRANNAVLENTTRQQSLQSSLLGVPGMNASFMPDISASTNSLNAKGTTADIEVIMSSCSKCHKCKSLVYDEEIMAGWIADESNLNTHCPFCSELFVPFLNIDLRDFRKYNSVVLLRNVISERNSTSSETSKSEAETAIKSEEPSSEEFSASFNLPFETSAHDKTAMTTNESSAISQSQPPISPGVVVTPAEDNIQSSPHNTASLSSNHNRSSSQASSAPFNFTATSNESLNTPMFDELEPITIPYLSPLVLRKNMESLLENEGTHVLTDARFVDQHPIMYWNLIWYFRRLNLHSNLYNLLLSSNCVNQNEAKPSNKGTVLIRTMWDNLKLHNDMVKPPFYWVWHKDKTQHVSYLPYPINFLNDVTSSIMKDDVRGPLVSTLHELSSHGPNAGRRSAYREILYLVIVALDKESIDVDAFDRVYRSAYNALSVDELTLVKKCDKHLSKHAVECRNIFGQLDLY